MNHLGEVKMSLYRQMTLMSLLDHLVLDLDLAPMNPMSNRSRQVAHFVTFKIAVGVDEQLLAFNYGPGASDASPSVLPSDLGDEISFQPRVGEREANQPVCFLTCV